MNRREYLASTATSIVLPTLTLDRLECPECGGIATQVESEADSWRELADDVQTSKCCRIDLRETEFWYDSAVYCTHNQKVVDGSGEEVTVETKKEGRIIEVLSECSVCGENVEEAWFMYGWDRRDEMMNIVSNNMRRCETWCVHKNLNSLHKKVNGHLLGTDDLTHDTVIYYH